MPKWEYQVGDKIKFKGEKQRYTIQACNDRYLICTKPFNPKRAYLYTIVDFERDVRGPDNLIFGSEYPYNSREGAEANLKALMDGEMEVSYRRELKLDIESIKRPKQDAKE